MSAKNITKHYARTAVLLVTFVVISLFVYPAFSAHADEGKNTAKERNKKTQVEVKTSRIGERIRSVSERKRAAAQEIEDTGSLVTTTERETTEHQTPAPSQEDSQATSTPTAPPPAGGGTINPTPSDEDTAQTQGISTDPMLSARIQEATPSTLYTYKRLPQNWTLSLLLCSVALSLFGVSLLAFPGGRSLGFAGGSRVRIH